MSTLLVNVGKKQLIAAIYGDAITPPTYIDWGTGTNAPAAGDTTLQTPGGEARVNGTKSKQTTTFANDTMQVIGTMTAAGSKTITEAGLFDAATVGNMVVRGTFTGIPLGVGDTIQFTIQIVQT